jgi:hypothetical protein
VRKKVKISRAVILLTLFLVVILGFKIKSNADLKLNSEEKEKVISLVSTYYNNMMNKDYKAALALVDLEKSDYEADLAALTSSNYNIKTELSGGNWIVPVNGKYDYVSINEQDKYFSVETIINLTTNNNNYSLNEMVYVKRLNNDFKIIKVDTTDRYSSIKASYINDIASYKLQ